MTAKKHEEFDEDLFETRLEALKDTQDGIQQMSSWCLEKRSHHKKIVQCWLNVFKRTRVEQRLVLFYLANDVIQYSKRKRFEFVESWATALQRATTMVRDEKVKNKVLRIFKIWGEREIYNEDYLSDLRGLLNIPPPKKAIELIDAASDEFSSAKLIAYIKECVQNADATDKSLKKVPKMPHADAETLKQQLKDKTHTEDCEKDLDRYITYMKAYYKNLQTELKTRRDLITEITNARKFYHGQLDEVKVVAAAYKNFGLRIRNLQKKLNELTPNLPSPMPSPDINAPSPEPDADLQLPDEQSPISVNFFKNSMNGYSSYLDGNLPFDINDFKSDDMSSPSKSASQPIEVIGGRSDDESYGSSGNLDFYKPTTLGVGYSSNSNISIPGINNSMSQRPMQSEYTSLARSAAQYGNIVLPPPPNPPSVFDGSAYSTHMPNYSNDPGNYNSPIRPPSQHIPPPPMPPTALLNTPDNATSSNSWNMPWNTPSVVSSAPNSKLVAPKNNYGNHNLSVIETPVSPPRFEREPVVAPLEYIEQDDPLTQGSDVDHRDLHLTPFSISPKLGLSAEKSRQLDIDHRNLISLTGSPRINEGEKKPWTAATTATGDVDYRATVLHQTFKAIETIPMPTGNSNSQRDSNSTTPSPSALMPPPLGVATSTTTSTSYASSSSESQKDETVARYDPTDMVIDMDMSDEDLDDILREVEDQKQQASSQSGENYPQPVLPPPVLPPELAELDDSLTSAIFAPTSNENTAGGGNKKVTPVKTPLLETPPEFAAPPPPLPPSQNMWDSANIMNMPSGYAQQMGGGGMGGPRMPFSPDHYQQQQQQQQQYQPFMRGNGRERGWSPHAMNSPYRGGPRPMRGGGRGAAGGGSPFFNRGGGGYRGRRGGGGGGNNNSWM